MLYRITYNYHGKKLTLDADDYDIIEDEFSITLVAIRFGKDTKESIKYEIPFYNVIEIAPIRK